MINNAFYRLFPSFASHPNGTTQGVSSAALRGGAGGGALAGAAQRQSQTGWSQTAPVHAIPSHTQSEIFANGWSNRT